MLCDSAAANEDRISLLGGGLDTTFAPSFPANLHASLAAVLRFDWLDRREQRHEVVLSCRDEQGTEVGTLTISLDLDEGNFAKFGPDDVSVLPLAIPLGGLTIAEPGKYEIMLSVDGAVATSLPLQVLAAA